MTTIYHYLTAKDHPDGVDGFYTHPVDEIECCAFCQKAKLNAFVLTSIKTMKKAVPAFHGHVFRLRHK